MASGAGAAYHTNPAYVNIVEKSLNRRDNYREICGPVSRTMPVSNLIVMCLHEPSCAQAATIFRMQNELTLSLAATSCFLWSAG